MNLYDLAHHPRIWYEHTNQPNINYLCKCSDKLPHNFLRMTEEQWEFMTFTYPKKSVWNHTDENEFRMHLLFVYFATTPTEEWP
jgi:hypothetical protein